MTIGVVGAGGVGGFFAAMLGRGGHEVLLMARGAHLAAIRQEGLTLQTREEAFNLRLTASDDAAAFHKTAEAVLFCTKGYDLKSAALGARAMIGPDTLLVPFGNGVGNAAMLQELYPQNSVANGAVYIVSRIVRPGVVRVAGKGALAVFGWDGAATDGAKRLGRAMRESGIKSRLSSEITTEVWRKFLLIAAMSTLTSCHDIPMGAVLAHHAVELAAVLDEIVAVGRAEGARLNEADKTRVLEQLAKVPYDAPTSMWLDFQKGGPTELEQLGGYVVKKAREHGLAVPVTARCYEALRRRSRT